ncbi:MAG TPA: hypothetical protein VHH36_03295 [Candidatus Thermoplasmatota archaeon]|nr:hypothetical protein [Candidatus Thermoplasmatota archaeon]
MISARYGPDVPPAIAEMLEHHARACGASLDALEVLGASLDFAERFIVAAESGRAMAWLREMGLAPPEEKRRQRAPGASARSGSAQ